MIDYKIPLWGIISTLVLLVAPMAWSIITMFFGLKSNTKELVLLKKSHDEQIKDLEKSHDDQIKGIKDEIYHQERAISSFKKDIEEKLDKHKHATDQKLSSINDITVETRTLVKLLVDNKLKTG